jgi:hypothetical protein
MANQYIDQMQESVRWAVFWNVWSLVSFQVWYHDASILKEVFWWDIEEDDLMNLSKYNVYLKQLIEWMPSPVFSSATFAPQIKDDEIFQARYDKILWVSREKYSKPRDFVVSRINSLINDLEKQEKDWEKQKEAYKEKKQEEKKKAHEEKMKAQEANKKVEENK